MRWGEHSRGDQEYDEYEYDFWRPSAAQRLQAQRKAAREASASAWRRNLTVLALIGIAVVCAWLLKG